MKRRSGLVVRTAEGRDGARPLFGFLPVERVESIVRMPRVSPVVGARPPMLGVAQVHGGVIPVIAPYADARPHSAPPGRDPSARVLVVCLLAGERLGLAGIEIVSVGHFDGDEASVRSSGERVGDVDLASLASELHARPWAGRVRA